MPEIDHDADEKRTEKHPVTFGMILAYGSIGAVYILPKYKDQIWDWRDYSAITATILLIWWLTSRRNSKVDAAAHEGMDNGLAFRFGKALNRVRRGFRR